MWRYRLGLGALLLATLSSLGWVVLLLGSSEPADSGDENTPESSPHAIPIANPTKSATPSDLPTATTTDEPTPHGQSVPDAAERVVISKHTDGDTLHVVAVTTGVAMVAGVDTTVRLLEIDTPESVDPSSPDQCYSAKASNRLAQLLPIGSSAWVLPDKELLDPYGRTLLYLWTEDGTFVNLSMVEQGYARAVLYAPNDMYISEMRAAEAQARADGLGLWGACDFFGQPRGVATVPSHAPKTRAPSNTDPRFSFCYEANDAGYGNYVSGRDPEYDWYDDADSDGRVCEF